MIDPPSTHAEGAAGERLAREYLEHCGLEILETNFRFGRGEIDIIAADGEDLVFCEVKLRHSDAFGTAEMAVTRAKQQQLRRIASGYLARQRIADRACRFDVVAIEWAGRLPHIHHITNAF